MSLWGNVRPTGAARRHLRDPKWRLRVFAERGLIPCVPTRWQFLLGQIEMAAYVALPDRGDSERYGGAPFGHPLLRTPIVAAAIGRDHLRIGHGLHAKPISLLRHLSYVFHEGMPVFDLQLVHSIEGGLGALRAYMVAAQESRGEEGARVHRWTARVLPDPEAYRACFLRPGGWIDRAEAFDYPAPSATADFLRPEFTSLVRFANYCAAEFEPSPRPAALPALPLRIARLATTALRDPQFAP